jgi:serine phosphatase RsbU (regulator of sigma subunit)
VTDDTVYDDASVALSPGGRICLFSDGIVEQMGSGDSLEQFGATRLARVLSESRDATPQRAIASAAAALGKWAGGTSFHDDVSIVVIDWVGGPASS